MVKKEMPMGKRYLGISSCNDNPICPSRELTFRVKKGAYFSVSRVPM